MTDLRALSGWIATHRAEIDRNPAAWTAVELALLDAIGREEGRSVEALLGVPRLAGRFRYTAVIGDAHPARFEEQLAEYRMAGFREFKIKLSGNRVLDLARMRSLTRAGVERGELRVDANNLWDDPCAAIEHLRSLGPSFFAVEEPLRAGDVAGLQCVAAALDARIVLDETLLYADQLDALPPGKWILNLRVSKMGGVLRTLEVARAARERGLDLIVGAHVGETSVLARAALTVAHAFRERVLAQEGAFGDRFLAYDMVEPPIVFGTAGVLDVSALRIADVPGLGLRSLTSDRQK